MICSAHSKKLFNRVFIKIITSDIRYDIKRNRDVNHLLKSEGNIFFHDLSIVGVYIIILQYTMRYNISRYKI